MPSFRTTRRVPFSPRQMFDLVADVERYPEFLPFCEALLVKKRDRNGGKDSLIADMSVGYMAIRETFTTRVTLDEPRLRIQVEYVEGPFSYLENRWTFKPDPLGCLVEFYITYEFKSRMLGLVMGSMFDRAFRKFAEAFEERADKIYGRAEAAHAS